MRALAPLVVFLALAAGQVVSAQTSSGETMGLELRDSPVLGRKDAPLTMIEFTDYQCGFCRRFHVNTFPEIKKKYIDTGTLRFASRDLPLSMHKNAFAAANAARCAGEQAKFWELRDVMINNAANLGGPAILGYADGLKLDPATFRPCLDSVKYQAQIQRDMHEAEAVGLDATPSFLLGWTTAQGVEGKFLVGAHPLATFEQAIQEMLRGRP
jgi:protein-disulfide isomerase